MYWVHIHWFSSSNQLARAHKTSTISFIHTLIQNRSQAWGTYLRHVRMNNSLRILKVNYVKNIPCKASELMTSSYYTKMKQLPGLVTGYSVLSKYRGIFSKNAMKHISSFILIHET